MSSVHDLERHDQEGQGDKDDSSHPQSLARAVYARRSEYTRPSRIRIKIGTWNVAAQPDTEKDLAHWFVDGKGLEPSLVGGDLAHNSAVHNGEDDKRNGTGGGNDDSSGAGEEHTEGDKGDLERVRLVGGDEIGLYVLGLQEIVDLNKAREYVTYSDPSRRMKWIAAIKEALPAGYELITEQQMAGLLLVVFASPSVTSIISHVSTTAVGTGILGYLGNKGAVATRILLGETTRIIFVNSHLASGHGEVQRRLWDVETIQSRAKFEKISPPGSDEADGGNASEAIGGEDFAFWFGDLNFRIDDIPPQQLRDLLNKHISGEYRESNAGKSTEDEDTDSIHIDSADDPSAHLFSIDDDESITQQPEPEVFLESDPMSIQSAFDNLLSHDQLRSLIKERKAFHDGWREGNITFLPSYKYDLSTVSRFDTSEKSRAPSWCDRILFRTRRDLELYRHRLNEEETARKLDKEMTSRGIDRAADDDNVLFTYDPARDQEDSGNESEEEAVATSHKGELGEYDPEGDGGAAETDGDNGSGDAIRQEVYTSHQRIASSDHKPIISVFTLDYDAVVPELKAKIHAEVARELDRAENESRPAITIVPDSQYQLSQNDQASDAQSGATSGITNHFGPVEYLRGKTATLTIANTGRVPATVSFLDHSSQPDSKPDSTRQWLTTSFLHWDPDGHDDEADALVDVGFKVTLSPGETVQGQLSLMVDDIGLVRALNEGTAELDEVLVLRVEGGRDDFILVKGTWIPTLFGRSLLELIRLPIEGGVKALFDGKKGRAIDTQESPTSPSPPPLVEMLCAAMALVKEITDVPSNNLYWPFEKKAGPLGSANRNASSKAQAQIALIDALERGVDNCQSQIDDKLTAGDKLEAVCSVLVHFLQTMPDGLIPEGIWSTLDKQLQIAPLGNMSSSSIDEKREKFLEILMAEPHRHIAWVMLTDVLRAICLALSPEADWPGANSEAVAAGASPRKGIRAFSFKMSSTNTETDARAASLARSREREKHIAQVIGPAAVRTGKEAVGVSAKDRKSAEDKVIWALEMFLPHAFEHEDDPGNAKARVGDDTL